MFNSWGNIFGAKADEEYNFSQEVYNETPGADISNDLTGEEDIVTQQLGPSFRMPTKDDFVEMVTNCTSIWTTLNGVQGRLFTSNINGNSIFMPAAGYFNGTSHNGVGTSGYYWSKSHYNTSSSYNLDFDRSGVYASDASGVRHRGFNVRPVKIVSPT